MVSWLEMRISSLGMPKPALERVARTNRRDAQGFWFKFINVLGASAFRGVVTGRFPSNVPTIQCDYVTGDEYSSTLNRGRLKVASVAKFLLLQLSLKLLSVR